MAIPVRTCRACGQTVCSPSYFRKGDRKMPWHTPARGFRSKHPHGMCSGRKGDLAPPDERVALLDVLRTDTSLGGVDVDALAYRLFLRGVRATR